MSLIGASALPEGTGDLLHELSAQAPLVPDELTQYVLRRNGQDATDPRLIRLVSLAGQRFIAAVVHDSLQICKNRLASATKSKLKAACYKDKRVLMPDDLARALKEFGINLNEPPYYVDTSKEESGSRAAAQ